MPNAMNADTQRGVQTILQNGYYKRGTTLGEGGWPTLYAQGVGSWEQYNLYVFPERDPVIIHARDDKTAQEAFFKLVYLEDCEWKMVKVQRVITVIASTSQAV